MINISEDLILSRLSFEYIRGNTLRTTGTFNHSNSDFKRIILLNNDFSIDDLYYVIVTSRTEWYKDNWKWVKKCCVLIPIDSVSFMEKETIINCREVYKLTKQNLVDRYGKRELDFLGILPKPILNEITHCLKHNGLILDSILQKIC